MLKEKHVDIPIMPHDELMTAQQEDPAIARVLCFMQIGRRLTYQERKKEPAIVRQLLHEWNKLFIAEDGILYHKSGCRDRMVLPEKYHKRVYVELHENMGYLGADRVVELARERFYWPFMRADITHYVTKVCRCLKQRKPATHVNAPFHPIISTAPFQLVSMDYVHLEPSSGGYQYMKKKKVTLECNIICCSGLINHNTFVHSSMRYKNTRKDIKIFYCLFVHVEGNIFFREGEM